MLNQTQSLAAIAIATTAEEMDRLFHEVELFDDAVWSAWQAKFFAVNRRAVSTTSTKRVEVVREAGMNPSLRRMKEAGLVAAQQLGMHQQAAELAAQLHREADQRFQQQCQMDVQIHLQFHHHGF